MNLKKLAATVSAIAMTAAALTTAVPSSLTESKVEVNAASAYNYGEALQKSMFFYEAQQSGEKTDWSKVSWKGDCMTNDYIPGGWFDAGDHLKFTLTNAYSATALGWGLLQYGDGVKKCGMLDEYLLNLEFALDYLVACDLGDEIVYMIGDGDFDHKWWGSAEVYMYKFELEGNGTERPYYTCKNSSIQGQMAAALAVGYLCFKDSNPTKADEYLSHAKSIFKTADAYRDIGGDAAETSYYNISSFWDDLFFAANWLYIATGDKSYLDLCETDYIDNLGLESQSDELKYTWGYCWDDTQQAGTLLYAMNTGDEKWKEQFRKHLEYWTTGYGGKVIDHTPSGLAWLFQWGSLRHATTTAFLAYVAVDELFADDSAAVKKYTEFADFTMNYCFGDNPLNMSYVVGMGDSYPQAWHHRTSSGVWNDKWSNIGQTEGEDAKPHAHTLYGALVGGPGKSDDYSDKIGDYQYTEVAIDYNAGYTAALCAMVEKYGGTIDPDFPEEEEPKWTEFYMEACINQESGSYTEIKAYTTNHSAWPARVVKDLSYRYYIDLSEVFEAGFTVDDVQVKIGYDEWGNCTISKPIQYDGNIYYIEIAYDDGTCVMPTGQSEHQGEIQFRVGVSDATPVWDGSNDYSIDGLVKQDMQVTDKITMYDGDTLIWGTEPDGTTPGDVKPSNPTEPSTKVTETTGSQADIEYGDVNCDGKVDISDAVALKCYLINSAKFSISAQGEINGDVQGNKNGLNAQDAVSIQKYILKQIDSLPVK